LTLEVGVLHDLEALRGPSPIKVPAEPSSTREEKRERPERRFGLPEVASGTSGATRALYGLDGLEAEVVARLTRLETKAKAEATQERWRQQRRLEDLDPHQWGTGAMVAFDAIDVNGDEPPCQNPANRCQNPAKLA